MSVLQSILTRQPKALAALLSGPSFTYDTSLHTSRIHVLPRAPALNELIIIFCFMASSSAVPAATGFTRINGGTANNYSLYVLWKVSNGTEGSNITVTSTNCIADFAGILCSGVGVEGGAFDTALSALNAPSVSVTPTHNGLAFHYGNRFGNSSTTVGASTAPWVSVFVFNNTGANPAATQIQDAPSISGVAMSAVSKFTGSSTDVGAIIINVF